MTEASVTGFIDSIPNEGRRADARVLVRLMEDVTREPAMLNGSIIGFGNYHYVYDSGHEGDAPLVGFAPRKANMVVYIMPGFSKYAKLLDKLGKHRTGSSCLYLGRLNRIDLDVLRELVDKSVAHMRQKYPSATRGSS